MRWLLPIFTVVALIGQSVTSFAAAGLIGEASCCCPVKAKCKCHDHEGKPDSSATLKRCAGDAKLIAPAVSSAIVPTPFESASELRVTSVPAIAALPILDDVSRVPEKPPF